MNWYNKLLKLCGVLGSWRYQVPADNKQKLFDFYLLTSLPYTSSGFNTDEINYAIDEAKETLYPTLKEHLLDVLFYAIMAELRHIEEAGIHSFTADHVSKERRHQQYTNAVLSSLGEDEKEKAVAVETFLEEFFNSYEDFRLYGTASEGTTTTPLQITQVKWKEELNEFEPLDQVLANTNRTYSFYAAKDGMEASGLSEEESIKIAQSLFQNIKWSPAYGGDAWAKICNGWLQLNEATNLNDMQVWIDHVYSLQHNSNTVFEKLNSYTSNGSHRWIQAALDRKFAAKSPWELFEDGSSAMRQLSGYALKAGSFGTQEEYKKDPSYNKAYYKGIQDTAGKMYEDEMEAGGDILGVLEEIVNTYWKAIEIDPKVADIIYKDFIYPEMTSYYEGGAEATAESIYNFKFPKIIADRLINDLVEQYQEKLELMQK